MNNWLGPNLIFSRRKWWCTWHTFPHCSVLDIMRTKRSSLTIRPFDLVTVANELHPNSWWCLRGIFHHPYLCTALELGWVIFVLLNPVSSAIRWCRPLIQMSRPQLLSLDPISIVFTVFFANCLAGATYPYTFKFFCQLDICNQQHPALFHNSTSSIIIYH